MAYFWISNKGGSGGTVDLSPIEAAIINKGGTVEKQGDKATVEEILSAISTIPVEGYGYPLNGATINEVVDMPTLNITEDFSITFKEATA